MRRNCFFKIVLVTSLLLVINLEIMPTCEAQEDNGMLIFQVDGNRYSRKEFNKEGALKGYQTIEIGKIISLNKSLETKMKVSTYSSNGELKDTSQTTLVCDPESQQVLMGVFPFAGDKDKTSLVVKMDDVGVMYPSGWRLLSDLKDFSFSLKFKGGTAGFLGTKSNISIINRKIMPLKNFIGVSGKIIMKVYVLGVKISTKKYKFYEKIHEQKGIVSQKFTENNGDYFTMEILD